MVFHRTRDLSLTFLLLLLQLIQVDLDVESYGVIRKSQGRHPGTELTQSVDDVQVHFIEYLNNGMEHPIAKFTTVWWVSCLLFISSRPFVRAAEGDATSSPVPETTTPDSEEEKTQGDLDLETQDQVAILKQINRVNDDGSYTFGYEAADGSFKIETRDVNGNVKGMFGFINEDGELKRVSYSASNGTGFQSTGTLNIPPLPGTTSEDDGRTFSGSYQLTRPTPKEESSTKINLLEPTTANYGTSPEIPSPRLPIYIYGSSTSRNDLTSTIRPVVIQHIPKVRPTPATSSTAPTESEEILHKPLFPTFVPQRTSNGNFISFGTNEITSTTPEPTTTEENPRQSSVIQVIRPRAGPFKKVIVTKRPVVTTTPKIVTTTEYQSKEYLQKLKEKEKDTEVGNGVRRQLGITNNYVTPTQTTLLTSGTEDSPDVYGGGHTSRPYPTNAYRTLFTQIPQHQRILQNSYIQNQNQYLAAALGNPGLQPAVTPQIVPNPGQGRAYAGAPPTPVTPVAPLPTNTANIPPRQNNYVPAPVPQPIPDPQNQRPFGVPPNYVRQYTPMLPVAPQYPPEQPLYIPPGLIEHLIRMLLAAQQRQRQQPVSPFQQAVIATLGPGNVPPELLENRYDSRYYQPYPNYSQAPPGYPIPMIPRPAYDPYYQAPGYLPGYNYQPVYAPLPYRFQPRLPPYDQGEDIAYRMLLGYPRFQAQVPVPPLQNPTNVVERSPVYQPEMDSTTSSTTPATRLGPVRNVQILGQINEESNHSNNYEESTKSGE